MLRHFQPFIDYPKMIKEQANGVAYRLSKKENKIANKKHQNVTAKTKKLGRKRGI